MSSPRRRGSRLNILMISNLPKLYYEISGKGPVIIFVHGLSGNYLSWWQQIPYFSKNFTCITISHRGYFPNKTIPIINPENFAEDLSELIDYLSLDKVNLIGQSMGGWTVLNYVLIHPEKVKSIVLSSTVGSIKDESIEKLMENYLVDSKSNTSTKDIFPGLGERIYREQPQRYYLYMKIDSLNKNLNKKDLKKKLLQTRNKTIQQVKNLNIPTLFVNGDEDRVMDPEVVSIISRQIPNSKHIIIPKAGHSTYFERSEQFNSLVSDFINQ